MEVFGFWAVFFLLSAGLIALLETLFPREVDAIAELLGFGDEPQWRR